MTKRKFTFVPSRFTKFIFGSASISAAGAASTLVFAFAANAATIPSVKIGAVLPMSGPVSAFGEDTWNGMQLAVEEINKGKQLSIKTVLEDDKSEVTDAATAALKVINVDKVNIVIGSVPSSNTNAMAPIAQKAGVPLLSPSSTNVNVTKNGDYISRICFIDDFQGFAMAKFAHDTLKAKKAAIVTDSASDYSIGLAGAFEEAFKKMGGEIVVKVSYVAKDQDFSSQLTKIRPRRPDVIFVPGYYQEVGNMLLQAKNLGIKVPFLGGDGWSPPEQLYKIAGDSMLNQYFADHFSAEDSDPKVKEFVAKFKAKFKTAPSAMAALGYDSVYFVADAIKRGGNKTDSKTIKEQINATKDFVGVTGKISLNADRNPTKPLVILQTIKNGATFKERVNP